MSGNKYCCLCGEARHPHQPPTETLSNGTAMLNIAGHRELKPGRWETSPQLLVSVCLYRNGGTAKGATHICDECLIVGLEEARSFIQYELSTRRAAVRALNRSSKRAQAKEGTA